MQDKSTIEAILGNPATQALVAAGAAYAGADPQLLQSVPAMLPVGVSLIPLLLNSLPQQRYQQRLEVEIAFLRELTQEHAELLEELTDPQYKFFNDLIPVLLQNYEEDKKRYLRAVVKTALTDKSLTHEQATIFARVIRDISASELAFLVHYFHYNAVVFDHPEDGPVNQEERAKLKWERLDDTPDNRLLISGLLSLGLMKSAGTWSDSYEFTPIVAKLLTLIQP